MSARGPYQVVVGRKGLASGELEVKDRASGERVSVPIDEVVAHVACLVESARADLAAMTTHP